MNGNLTRSNNWRLLQKNIVPKINPTSEFYRLQFFFVSKTPKVEWNQIPSFHIFFQIYNFWLNPIFWVKHFCFGWDQLSANNIFWSRESRNPGRKFENCIFWLNQRSSEFQKVLEKWKILGKRLLGLLKEGFKISTTFCIEFMRACRSNMV